MSDWLEKIQTFNKALPVLAVGAIVFVLNVVGWDVNEFVALLVALGGVIVAPKNKAA